METNTRFRVPRVSFLFLFYCFLYLLLGTDLKANIKAQSICMFSGGEKETRSNGEISQSHAISPSSQWTAMDSDEAQSWLLETEGSREPAPD